MPPLPRNGEPVPPPVDAAALESRLAGLIAESAALRTDLKGSEAQRRKENLISMASGVLIIIFIALVLAVATQNRAIAEDARQSALEAKKTSDIIADCITPTGKCYRDGSKRTGGAVGNIIKAEMILKQCDREFPTSEPGYNTCVTTRLAKLLPAAATTPPVPAPSKSPAPKT